jgi:dTDP-4-amino-4,6-dideoxygalactose transaminase
MAATAIPLVNLNRFQAPIKDEIAAAIGQVIEDSAFVGGAAVTAFEEAFARYCGARHCVSVGNATDGLMIALLALGIGRGDEVVTTATSFFATAEAIGRIGATPVFCDIDPDTANIDPRRIESRIGPATKAILPVHLYGRAAEIGAIMDIAKRHRLAVVEDCAQAVGARVGGRAVGTFGSLGCFSFYPSKNLGAFGDGGAIITDDDDLALACRQLSNHGGTTKYVHEVEGYNSRLDGIQAAVLSVKLPRLDDWNADRRRLAGLYDRLLARLPVERLRAADSPDHVHHLYTVRVQDRDRVLDRLRKAGIGADVHYPDALPFLKPYRDRGHQPADFPVAARHAASILSLPIFPAMRDDEAERIVAALADALEAN